MFVEQLDEVDRQTLREVLGTEWLEAQVALVTSRLTARAPKNAPKFVEDLPGHPLILPWMYTTGQALPFMTPASAFVAIAQLRGLAETLRLMWPRLDSELRRKLTSRLISSAIWEGAFYELRAASAFVKSMQHTKMLPEAETTMPDLLIEPGVYIECKKKDLLTPHDKQYEQFWDEFCRRADRLLVEMERSLVLSMIVQGTTNIQDIPDLLAKLREKLSASPDDAGFNHDKYAVIWATIAPWGALTPRGNIVDVSRAHKANAEGQSELTPQGLLSKNVRVFRSRSEHIPDRVREVRQSLKKAGSQLPESHPGLVYVELPVGTDEQFDLEVEQLRAPLQDRLANDHRRITAVVFTANSPERKAGGCFYMKQRKEVVRNPASRHPLPDGFIIPDLWPLGGFF